MTHKPTDIAIKIVDKLDRIARSPAYNITSKTIIEIADFVYAADQCSLVNKELCALFTQCLESMLSHITQYREPENSVQLDEDADLHVVPYQSNPQSFFILVVYQLTEDENYSVIPTVYGIQLLDIDTKGKWKRCSYLDGIVNLNDDIKFPCAKKKEKGLKGHENYHHVFSTKIIKTRHEKNLEKKDLEKKDSGKKDSGKKGKK